MNGLLCKNFNTVIMDASNEEVVRNIVEGINIVTEERCGSATCRPFSDKRPDMKVVTTRTTKRKYESIRGMIERAYPGLCAFDVAM